MDNYPIAQVFSDIADLLEIKGENLFKIRAYRSAADTIRAWADPVARMDEKQLLELPAVGKDLAKKIRELAESGACRFHRAGKLFLQCIDEWLKRGVPGGFHERKPLHPLPDAGQVAERKHDRRVRWCVTL